MIQLESLKPIRYTLSYLTELSNEVRFGEGVHVVGLLHG